jgi:hypothetical protein
MSQQIGDLIISSPATLSSAEHADILKKAEEINAHGAAVVSVVVEGAFAPAKFFIRFVAPIAQVRLALEAKLYDIGHETVGAARMFYVTKRLEPSKGWSE